MPNLKKDRKDNSYPKHKFSQQNKKVHVNLKKYNESNETARPLWLKISCSTDLPGCKNDILHELEQILFRYGDIRKTLQALNPTYSGGRLDFFLKLTKFESKTLYKNYIYINRYELKCTTCDDVNLPHVFPKEWVDLIMQVLNSRFSNNKETGEIEVNLSSFSNDQLLMQQGLMLQLSNPAVMKQVLSILKSGNLKSITKLDLSNNYINNINHLERFFEHCSVSHVDLSNNRLSRPVDFKFMSKNTVKELNVLKNDFDRKYNPRQLQDEIRKWIPELLVLNGKKLPDPVRIAGELDIPAKKIPESILSDKSSDIFLIAKKICTAFDKESRDELCDFYSTESVMSLSCYSNDIPNCYRSLNSNVKSNNHSTDIPRKKGTAEIVGSFAQFPKTKHIESTLNVEMPVGSGNNIMLIVTGVWIEYPNKGGKNYRAREFSRHFVIADSRIIQDHLTLMATDSGLNLKYKAAIERLKDDNYVMKDLTTEQINIIKQFKDYTGMTAKACLEFLSKVELSEAAEKFTNLKNQGQIPRESFDQE